MGVDSEEDMLKTLRNTMSKVIKEKNNKNSENENNQK